MKKVNKTDAATLLNNFKVDLYITALTAVEVVLITHSVMYCSTHYHGNVLNTRVVPIGINPQKGYLVGNCVMAIMVLSLSALAPDHSLLVLLCCAYLSCVPRQWRGSY